MNKKRTHPIEKNKKMASSSRKTPRYAPIGRPSVWEALTTSPIIRGIIIAAIALAAIGGFVMGIVAISRSVGADRSPNLGQDGGPETLNNHFETAVVEVWIGNPNFGVFVSCSGVFVSPTGAVLTAVHCFQVCVCVSVFFFLKRGRKDVGFCDFNVTSKEYPLFDPTFWTYYVDVSGINGGTDKRTFQAVVKGWSGVTDVMVLQLLPLTYSNGTATLTVELKTQAFLKFDDSSLMLRGDPVATMSYDLGMSKKTYHDGKVQLVNLDRSTSFAVSAEQLFFFGDAQEGASGSGIWNRDGNLVMAPLSYGWYNGGGDVFMNSGTSTRVSAPIVRNILDPNYVFNGPGNNKVLTTSLGIITFEANDGINLYNFDPFTAIVNVIPNIGIFTPFLASQDWFDFLSFFVFECLPPYNVTQPSMLNATLDTTIYGSPPALWSEVVAFDFNTYPFLLAIEPVLGSNVWVEVGDGDNGLSTISGLCFLFEKKLM